MSHHVAVHINRSIAHVCESSTGSPASEVNHGYEIIFALLNHYCDVLCDMTQPVQLLYFFHPWMATAWGVIKASSHLWRMETCVH